MKHAIGIENAKQLQELGVDAPACHWGDAISSCHTLYVGASGYPHNRLPSQVQLYSVGELGEMLPEKINDGWLTSQKCGLWEVGYETGGMRGILTVTSSEGQTEADARAKMLIWLIEQGHVVASDLK